MANPIKSSDLYQDDGALKRLVEELERAGKAVEGLRGDAIKLTVTTKKLNATQADGREEIARVAQSANALEVEQKKLNEAYTDTNKKIQALRKERAQANRIAKLEAQAANSAAGSYNKLSAQYALNKVRLNGMSDSQRKATKEGQRLERQTKDVYEEMKRLQEATGKYSLDVGNYKKSFTGLATTIKAAFLAGGVVEAIRAVSAFVRDSVMVFADFSRQISFLGAVSGASAEELAQLEAKARELGETTQFSASQVAQLEIEYAKLGFKPKEILDATADSLNLASVAQSDLGQTATVVGSVIRAFNFDASEAGRVADVAAKAFSSSALDMEKFSVAMAAVAPVANSAGVSLEKTTALLGVLVDAGLDASTAGTGLRNVFLDIADKGITFEDALNKINTAQDKNVASLELFGKRGATIGTVLAANTARFEELNKVLDESTGFAKEAGDAITNDLRGRFDALKSSVEAFKITIIGLVEESLTAFLGMLINVVRALSTFALTLAGIPRFIQENRVSFIALGVAVLSFNANAIAVNATLLISNARAVASAAAQKAAAIATNIWTVAQKGLNVALKSNPIGLVVSAIALLIAGLSAAYNNSIAFRGAINGLGSVAKELFIILKESIGSFIDTFKNLAEGDFKGAIKSFGEVLRKGNPVGIALTQGQRLGDAYRKGYSDTMQEAAAEGKEIIEGHNEAASRGANITTAAFDEMEGAAKKYTGAAKEAAIETEKLATGSLALLRKEISDIESKIKGAAFEDIQPLMVKLLGAEQALEQAENIVEQIRAKLQDSISSVEPIPILSGTVMLAKTDAEEVAQIAGSVADRAKEIAGESGGVDPEGIKLLGEAFETAKAQVGEYFDKRVELANMQSQRAAEGVQEAQNALQIQLQLAEAGLANRAETAQAELQIAKQKQEEAQKQQEKARKTQLIAQSIEQASNLITAISKLWVNPGFPLAIPATALLLGSFAAAKIKAFQATKLFREGGFEVLSGGSHASGNDVPIYTGSDGVQRRAEGGEGMAIFSKKATRQYGSALPGLVQSINRGEFEIKYAALSGAADGIPVMSNIVNVNTKGVETRLDKLRKDNRERSYVDGKGRTVRVIGNRKITYV